MQTGQPVIKACTCSCQLSSPTSFSKNGIRCQQSSSLHIFPHGISLSSYLGYYVYQPLGLLLRSLFYFRLQPLLFCPQILSSIGLNSWHSFLQAASMQTVFHSYPVKSSISEPRHARTYLQLTLVFW